jgi:hypothetical protein
LREVMENLIDSLVIDSSSMVRRHFVSSPLNLTDSCSSWQDVVACVKTVSILSAVDSSLLTTAKASLLVPFLKGATTVRLIGMKIPVRPTNADTLRMYSPKRRRSAITYSSYSGVRRSRRPRQLRSSVKTCKTLSYRC